MSATQRQFPAIDFKTRFPALDGIRALAVTMVFLRHFGGGSHGGRVLRTLNHIREYGWLGVDIFFVLSGFLITGILFDTRNDSHFFKRFFARRSLRIFPVFYLVVAVLLALTPVFHYRWRWPQLTFLVYMGNFFANYDFSLYEVMSGNHQSAKIFIGHFWSLCVEEQFYLLWPLAVWLIRDRVRLIWTATGISVLALLLRVAMFLTFTPGTAAQWIVRTLPFRMDTLLFGAILALLLRGPQADWWQKRCKWIFAGATGLLLSVIVISPGSNSPLQLIVGLTLAAAASAGLIGTALRAGSPTYKLFYLRPMRILGKYSYGFYIYHVLFGWGWIQFLVWLGSRTHSLALSGIIALTLNFFVTFAVSKLSYDLFEVRFLRFKMHFEYDSEVVEHKHAFTPELVV